MIKSMTGFGKAQLKSKYGTFAVEIRTVNHRYFDISLRAPNSFNMVEDKIKNYVHKSVKRGKVNVSLSHKKAGNGNEDIKIDHKTAGKYYHMLDKLNKKFKLNDSVSIDNILQFPDVIVHEQPEHDAEAMWPFLEKSLKRALAGCDNMRKKEGRNLNKDLDSRIDRIRKSLDAVSKIVPQSLLQHKKNLDRRLKELLNNRFPKIDRNRLETELAFMAKQSDVSEELTRAGSHLGALKETIGSTKEAGRRIDFLLQELQREINTLGSKAGNIKISRCVVDIKSEIEKMREQAQNVE